MTTFSADPIVGPRRSRVVGGVLVFVAAAAFLLYYTSGFGLIGSAPDPVSMQVTAKAGTSKSIAAPVSTDASAVSPKAVAGATTVDAQAARVLFDRGAGFIDTRIDADWEAGRIPGAVHLELKSNFTDGALRRLFRTDAELVIYCNGESCLRSAEAAVKALGWGFTKVYYFRDGYPAWKAASHPLE